MPTLVRLFLKIMVASALISCSPANDADMSSKTLAELKQVDTAHKKAMENMNFYMTEMAEKSFIVAYGQVQKNDDGVYLEVIEYLKAPEDIRSKKRLPLGEGVEPGRNIPVLNDMALTMFDKEMNILNISETIRGSQHYEVWRNKLNE